MSKKTLWAQNDITIVWQWYMRITKKGAKQEKNIESSWVKCSYETANTLITVKTTVLYR